jgi:diketogulonate reductase-like aldo/keto reductase
MNMKLQTVSGKELHPIGIGTWGFGGSWEADYDNDQEGIDAIRYSISKGQNHIDSGQIYGAGHTDEIVGKAIAGLTREDLFVTDKVWETNVAKGKVRPAVVEMLRKLGTDYIDILYIHKPWEDFPWKEAIPQINELIDEGLVRHFGASNFTVQHLKEAQELSKHPIVTNQLHHNILHKDEVTDEMEAFCKQHNIQIVAYKPLERGEVLKNETVQAIAKAHKATPVQIALAWLTQQGFFAIPKAEAEDLIDQNIAAVDIKLSADEMDQLNKL